MTALDREVESQAREMVDSTVDSPPLWQALLWVAIIAAEIAVVAIGWWS